MMFRFFPLIMLLLFSFFSCESNDGLVRDEDNTIKHPLSAKFAELYQLDFSLKESIVLFDSNKYYLANSEENNLMYGLEFTKNGAISEKSDEIVTLCQLKYKNKYKDYLLYYLKCLKANNDKISFKMYKNDKAPNQNEYVLNISIFNLEKQMYERCIIKIFEDRSGMIQSYAFSKRYPLAQIVSKADDLSEKDNLTKAEDPKKISVWIAEITKMQFAMFQENTRD